jgi:hypothetical protein
MFGAICVERSIYVLDTTEDFCGTSRTSSNANASGKFE